MLKSERQFQDEEASKAPAGQDVTVTAQPVAAAVIVSNSDKVVDLTITSYDPPVIPSRRQ